MPPERGGDNCQLFILRGIMFFRSKKRKKVTLLLILALTVLFCSIFGWGASLAMNHQSLTAGTKSVDKAVGNFVIGKDLYLENCSTCHIPIPPAVLPSETWQTILENPGNHYGVRIDGIVRFTQVLMWQYLQQYSRQLLKDEPRPKFIAQSRYFFALHPDIKFTTPVTHNTCIECHNRAIEFDYSVTNE
ncbi:dihem cytochrome c family protein [Cyanobacterium aponinum IPPAS B-1201]|nr:dihem cytochrome c family protein [Cyanobacterium aponinum IPPAS B-1201]